MYSFVVCTILGTMSTSDCLFAGLQLRFHLYASSLQFPVQSRLSPVPANTFLTCRYLLSLIHISMPFQSCQLNPTVLQPWKCSHFAQKQKIREPRAIPQFSEIPLFQAIFNLYLSFLDINTTVSTWGVWGNISIH